MLHIRDIKKQYVTGDLVQTALDGVTLTLRDNEFVAILGPSGSGKTTLLNVIGGLDRYDSGDLIINGISTKKYTDRDWDSYRNHTVGFVFQSYNLIPHQTVLSNVELALTISGVSRAERRARAKKALEQVGLGNQLHKRPNQMSGGQMQRVAIARALVNDPDILLADEPTGALDSETSVQVMELLKEVSKDRLVVMVTHNPELAEDYANRIVRVRDGKIIDDTNPCEPEEGTAEHRSMGRASMSFFTALSLSFNNLKTKKGRTILTAFAGSIGIIGIALILSLSTGFQMYIDQIQEDTLSSYPLMIQTENTDMASLMSAYGSVFAAGKDAAEDTVVEQQMLSQMFAQVNTNDLASFKSHLEENYDDVDEYINDVRYHYGIKPLIYSADTSKGVEKVNPGTLFAQITGMSAIAAFMDSDIFQEMIDDRDMLETQYEVIRGRWPEEKDELVVVLSSAHQISDYAAYTLGLKDKNTILDLMEQMNEAGAVEFTEKPEQWTYDDLMKLEFRLVPRTKLYRYNSSYTVWEDMSDDDEHMQSVVASGMPLKVVGIVCPREGSNATLLTEGVAFSRDLTTYVISESADSAIVKSQLSDPDVNVFTGKPFGEESSGSELEFEDMIEVDGDQIASAFNTNISTGAIVSIIEKYLEQAYNNVNVNTGPAKKAFIDGFTNLATDMLKGFIAANADGSGEATLRLSDVQSIVNSYLGSSGAGKLLSGMEKKYSLPSGTMKEVYNPLLVSMLSMYIASESVLPDLPDLPDLPEIPESSDPTQETEEGSTEEPTQESTEATEDSTVSTEPVTEPSVSPETEPVTTEPPVDETVESLSRRNDNGAKLVLLSNTGELTPPEEPEAPSDPPNDSLDILQTMQATISAGDVPGVVSAFASTNGVQQAADAMSVVMMNVEIQEQLMREISKVFPVIMSYVGSSISVDEEKLASAFKFNMDEEELRRLMMAMSGNSEKSSYESNLRSLGYAETEKPTAISIYFVDFAGKSEFLNFLDAYNEKMEAEGMEDQIISYTDVTNIMMSSVRTIIDSVSYVLIAFVAVSLVVSSIMIGIITYISVMERTKEIGVLRAIGASKNNISQVFNAETFIIGLCSGVIGIGSTLLLNIPINYIIHSLTDNTAINAQLPVEGAFILIVLSMVLTLIGGLIPSRQAAKKDPVIALRSE